MSVDSEVNDFPTKSRKDLLDHLSNILTVNEAASLVAKINEKSSKVNKGRRFGLYPITDWSAFIRTKVLEAAYWPADEVEFYADRNDFNSLSKEEQEPLLMAFGFFAVGDGSIANMLAYQMIVTADTFEKQCFYVVQLNNERVHAETYGKMIYTLVSDPNERDRIFNAVEKVESIKKMNQFIEDAFTVPYESDTNNQVRQRQLFVSLAAAEYVMFTPLFCIIFWYRAYKKGRLSKVIFSNELIAKDEASHCQNGCENYKGLAKEDRYSDDEVWIFIDRVVKLVCDFADEVLAKVNLPDLTCNNVKQYVKYVADDLFERLGHDKYYHVANPFVWMNFTSLIPKTNFYEGTVGEYSRINVKDSVDKAIKLVTGAAEEKKKNAYTEASSLKF